MLKRETKRKERQDEKERRDETKEHKRPKGNSNASLLSQLECVVCFTSPIFPPIRQCPNGHVLCDACSKTEQCTTCPQCRAHPTNIRCLALEKAAEGLLLACPFAGQGCKQMCPYEDAGKHTKHCDFKPFKCPLKFGGVCVAMLQANTEDMCGHIREHHNITTELVLGDWSPQGWVLVYEKCDVQLAGHGKKRCWKERMLSAEGMHFLVSVQEHEGFYQVFVKCLAANCDCWTLFDCTLTVGKGRRQLIWKAPVHGLAHASRTMFIPTDWASKLFKEDCALVVQLTISRAS